MYPQTLALGQMSYPTQPFPPYMSPHHHWPTPSLYQLDPTSFRREYTALLSELTVNSRPIIQNLSMIAQECSRWAEVVVQCIEAHIRKVSSTAHIITITVPHMNCEIYQVALVLDNMFGSGSRWCRYKTKRRI
jgi:hypothetical protein